MVNIAIFWTWYRNRTTVSAKRRSQRCAVPTKHGLYHRHSLLFLIGSSRPLQGVQKVGTFTMTLAPPLNHVAQCPKRSFTLIIVIIIIIINLLLLLINEEV
jgi:hypothetical protein